MIPPGEVPPGCTPVITVHGLRNSFGEQVVHEDLAAADLEVEIVVDDLLAEAVPQPPHLDDRRAVIAIRSS